MPHLGTRPIIGGKRVGLWIVGLALVLIALVAPLAMALVPGFSGAEVFECDKTFWSQQAGPELLSGFFGATRSNLYGWIVLLLSAGVFGLAWIYKLYAVRLRDLPGVVTWSLLIVTGLGIYSFLVGLGEVVFIWMQHLDGEREMLVQANRQNFNDKAYGSSPDLRLVLKRDGGLDELVEGASFLDPKSVEKRFYIKTPVALYRESSRERLYRGCQETLALVVSTYDPQTGSSTGEQIAVKTYLPLKFMDTGESRAWEVNWPMVTYLASHLGGSVLFLLWVGYYLILLSPIALFFVWLTLYPRLPSSLKG